MRKWRPAWIERLRILIGDAQQKCGAPNNAREIAKEIRFTGLFKRLESDTDIKLNLLASGLGHEIREYLKDGNVDIDEESDGPEGITEEQLELWPSPLRTIIADIKRSRVYVPSRSEYVVVKPEELSRQDAAEAGAHLIKIAAETDREGRLLVLLSTLPSEDWK